MKIKKRKSGIYGIFDGNDKCIYVGRGTDVQDRKHYHWSRCRNGKHGNTELMVYWNETDGENTWRFEILEMCAMKDFQFYEDYYITKYNTINQGFNKERASKYSYNTNTYKKKKVREHRSEINSGENNPRAKHTREQIIELKIMLREGYGYQAIADKLEMTYSYVALIANGYSWKDITEEEVDAAIEVRKDKSKGKVVYLELEPLTFNIGSSMNTEVKTM